MTKRTNGPNGISSDPARLPILALMAAGAPRYDPKPIETLAARLERKADALMLGGAVAGAGIGAAVGAVPLTPLDTMWGIPSMFGVATLMVGGLVGGLIGYVIGVGRALAYRARAQLLLCQVRTERQTALTSQLLVKLASKPAAAPPPAAVELPAPPQLVQPPVSAGLG